MSHAGEGTSPTNTTRYLHKDHLGSVVAITSETGTVVESLAYDAWGKRRPASTWQTPSPGVFIAAITLTRGFTMHEHLDQVGLIHMGGRVYDPEIGRFLSPDPFVQFAISTQGFNRYAYVGNNPLSYTDPSGYFLKELMKVVGIGLNFVPGFQGWSTAFMRGFVTGFLVSGGNARAAMLGGIGGAAFGKLGKMEWGAEKALAHGLVGGALSTAGGGRFGDGFLGAAVAQGFAEKIDDIGLAPDGQISTDPGMQLARVTAAAAVGGTASALGGGKFANGAGMAAFARLYNDEAMHPRRLKTLEEAVNFQLDRSEAAYARLNSEPPLAIGGGYTNQPVGGFIYREHLVKIGPFRLWPTDNFTVGYTVHVDRPHGFVDTWATGRPRHAVALAVYVGPSNIQIPNFSRMSATWQIPVVVRYSNGLVQRYEPAK